MARVNQPALDALQDSSMLLKDRFFGKVKKSLNCQLKREEV
jgi:hypothetical protein